MKPSETAQIEFIKDFEKKLFISGYAIERDVLIEGKYRILTKWERVELLLQIALMDAKIKVIAVEEICKMLFGLSNSKIQTGKRIIFVNEPQNYYVYQLVNSDDEIVYIGKGKGRRAWSHLRYFDRSNPGKSKYIQSEINAGRGVAVEILYDNLNEHEAFDIEARLIKKHKAVSPLFNIKGGQKTKASSLAAYLGTIKDSFGISSQLQSLLTNH